MCVALLAVISNCDEWEEIEMFGIKNKNWLRKFLLLTGGIPSAQTYTTTQAVHASGGSIYIKYDFFILV